MPDWITTYLSPALVIVGALVTAIATIMLWRVTRTLAKETKRMADALGRPQVVATLEPNRWAMNHADFQIENTGTGTAYKIKITFDPTLSSVSKNERTEPVTQFSVLKPGQRFRCYLSEFAPLLAVRFTVTVSWLRDPLGTEREELTYDLNMTEVANVSQLGPADPGIELAEQVKKLREDWRHIATGFHRLKADVYSSGDRLHEQRQIHRRRQSRATAQPPPSPPPV